MTRLWIALVFFGLVLGVALLDDEAGLPAWYRLRGDLRAAKARIAELRSEIATLEAETEALRADSHAIEAAIREDLELARPGETIVEVVPRGGERPLTR